MGHIKEPKGVDFTVSPSVLNDEDRKAFSDAIANYRKTGEIQDMDQTSITNHKRKHITDKNHQMGKIVDNKRSVAKK